MMRAPCAIRGPGRTSTSDCWSANTQMRCSRIARIWAQPGRCAMPGASRAPTMIRSGLARTTNSGLSLGNGPIAAGMMFLAPSRIRVSPINEDSPAPCGAGLTSKYTRMFLAEAGSDCAAAATAASMVCQMWCASGTSSNRPSVAITRRTSAWDLGSSATTLSPNASKRSAARELVASNTRSGCSATTASIFGSSPPPIRGKALTLTG